MYYPRLEPQVQSRLFTEVFGGYNHNLKIFSGEWYDTTNLTSDRFPLFSQREKRGTVLTADAAPSAMLAKDALMYVNGDSLIYNGQPITGITLSTASEMLPKHLVSMGAYAVVFPDKKYVNTKDLSDYGSLDASFTTPEDSVVSYAMTRIDGTEYENAVVSDTQPDEVENGALWIDTSVTPHSLKQYSAATAMWQSVPTVYVKISHAGIGESFAQYDGVKLSGITGSDENPTLKAQLEALNTDHVIYARGNDYIVVVGIIDMAFEQTIGTVSVKREAPDVDYVTECDNRLWGCKYGVVNGETVNEIYACALGDFKNWRRYTGISTDSYAVTVGTDGKFTGAITHQGYPLFFKENCLHKIYGAAPASFSVHTTECRGVQDGSHASLQIVAEVLYYKSRTGVCAYDGALPVEISEQLGGVQYTNAVAGWQESKYYISMKDKAGAWHLFVYDTARRIWMREDNTRSLAFANVRGELLFFDSANRLISATGKSGTAEADVSWSATSGIMGYEMVDAKYISRFNFRVKLGNGATFKLEIEYDSSGTWVNMGEYTGAGVTATAMIPVVPRRCDHLRLRLSGVGDVKMYSMARILEQGGDG